MFAIRSHFQLIAASFTYANYLVFGNRSLKMFVNFSRRERVSEVERCTMPTAVERQTGWLTDFQQRGEATCPTRSHTDPPEQQTAEIKNLPSARQNRPLRVPYHANLSTEILTNISIEYKIIKFGKLGIKLFIFFIRIWQDSCHTRKFQLGNFYCYCNRALWRTDRQVDSVLVIGSRPGPVE